jgi:hypothetical protein
MSSPLVCFRLSVFVLFIICSCIICSVGAWNLGVASSANLNSQISAYFVFLGAFGILCGLPVMLIDIVRKNALTSRIWVECVGVGIFWVLYLSGAAAISANFSDAQCSGNVRASALNACTSAKVLIGFSWIVTFTLLIYAVSLTVCTIIHQTEDSQVWHATVRDYPWFSNRSSQRLHSAPSSPMAEKGMAHTVAAPKPRHPMPSLSSEKWVMENSLPQRPPQTHDFNDVKHSYAQEAPAVPEPTSAESGKYQRPVLPKIDTVPTLYPAQVQSVSPPTTRSSMKLQSARVEPTPPALGKWPQKTQAEHRIKRKPVSPTESIASSVSSIRSQASTSSSVSRTGSVKPKGPRAGSHPKTVITQPPPSPPKRKAHRPPPLNLNGITSVKR